ncbi:DUF3168 domain-containing protein [Sphingomonas sp. TREG-RG-20F-R18-01]|uniref:tail completion protein gp17 n=1 Tax=Sphingomonas sp. TREG-RG-20F-R18-01 TaxID=2914982 RepID=UPI001F562707|nr:DUF3168 domain-containing protein [Sphingomonas sp. TREG-RG-20F-R18-01]
MIDPIDLMDATRAAVFRRLSEQVPNSLCPVFDDVPQNTQPPFLKIGAIDTQNEESRDGQFERLTVEIIAIYRGNNRSVLLKMMHAGRRALDRQALNDANVNFLKTRFITASASDASKDDGVTYAGISNYEIFAEPA